MERRDMAFHSPWIKVSSVSLWSRFNNLTAASPVTYSSLPTRVSFIDRFLTLTFSTGSSSSVFVRSPPFHASSTTFFDLNQSHFVIFQSIPAYSPFPPSSQLAYRSRLAVFPKPMPPLIAISRSSNVRNSWRKPTCCQIKGSSLSW